MEQTQQEKAKKVYFWDPLSIKCDHCGVIANFSPAYGVDDGTAVKSYRCGYCGKVVVL